MRPVKPEEEAEADALLRNVKKSFDELLSLNPRIGKDVVFAVNSNNDPAMVDESNAKIAEEVYKELKKG